RCCGIENARPTGILAARRKRPVLYTGTARCAVYRFAGVEFHIPRNIQVRQPVTVVVQKNGSGGPQAEGRDAGPPGLLTEGPVSVIPKEETAPVASDVDVIIAVAVS